MSPKMLLVFDKRVPTFPKRFPVDRPKLSPLLNSGWKVLVHNEADPHY
jgi:hypothetical protein